MDRISALEAAVAALTRRIAELEARVGAETPAAQTASPALAAASGAPLASPPADFAPHSPGELAPLAAAANAALPASAPGGPADAAVFGDARALASTGSLAALFGRTCLVLGGAFLIRALTEGGTLPGPVGVAAGLVYALVWLALASRGGTRPFDATLHGFTALVIADPLLLEATARLHVLSPRGALALLAGITLLAFAVAAARRLETLAWAFALGALGTAAAVFFESYDVMATAAFLLTVGFAAWALAERRGWGGPRWPLMIVADLLVLQAALLVARPGGVPEGYVRFDAAAVSSLGVALAFASLGATLLVTLVRKKQPGVFEQVQTLLALLVGLGAAVAVSAGPDAAGMGAFILGIGGGSYAISFVFVEQRLGRGRNFFFYSTLALLMTLGGTWVLFPERALPGLWAALGLAAAYLGGRFDRVTLRAHAALFLAGAALASGLAPRSFAALASSGGAPLPRGGLLVLLGCLVAGYLLLLAMQRRPDLPSPARIPRFAVALLALAGLGALATLLLARLFSGAAPAPSPAALAVARTVVLALSALLLAEAGRHPAIAELGWLAWPLLVAGGLKLLVEDLRVGRPATLFPAFVVYGLALWMAPRLLRRRRARETGSPAQGSRPEQQDFRADAPGAGGPAPS